MLVLLGALLCWSIWLFEIWLRGWNDLGWLRTFNGSAPAICLLIATSASFSVARTGVSALRRLLFIALSSALALETYLAARQSLIDIFSGFYFPAKLSHALAPAVTTGLVLAFGMALSAHWLLAPVRWWTSALLACAQPLAVLLGLLTILVIPAFHGSQDEVHVFKMGYPVLIRLPSRLPTNPPILDAGRVARFAVDSWGETPYLRASAS